MDTSQKTLPLIELKELAGNDILRLDATQSALLPYVDTIAGVWWALWICTLVFVIHYVWRHGDRSIK